MPGIAGKLNRAKVGLTSGGTFYNVAGLKSSSIELDGAVLDDSEFGVDWQQKLQGLKNFKISMSGSYRADDTNGQVSIRSAFINDTELWAQVLPDGTNGFKGKVIVTKFGVEPSVDGITSVSIELEGTGAITIVSA
ncbi:MAG: hypothetical protein C0503_02900 [Gemmatimonas sp.]|nr:hypothetical protein [Gemmatimonas sp.]